MHIKYGQWFMTLEIFLLYKSKYLRCKCKCMICMKVWISSFFNLDLDSHYLFSKLLCFMHHGCLLTCLIHHPKCLPYIIIHGCSHFLDNIQLHHILGYGCHIQLHSNCIIIYKSHQKLSQNSKSLQKKMLFKSMINRIRKI